MQSAHPAVPVERFMWPAAQYALRFRGLTRLVMMALSRTLSANLRLLAYVGLIADLLAVEALGLALPGREHSRIR